MLVWCGGENYLVNNLQVVGGELGGATLATAQGGNQPGTVQAALEENDESNNQDDNQHNVDPPRLGTAGQVIPR